MSEIKIHYIIGEGSAEEQNYPLYFDEKDMRLLEKTFEDQELPSPEWAELDKHKCDHCPLSSDDYKYCPAALSIWRIANKFADVKSYSETTVRVVTQERSFVKNTSTQEALSSIFGLTMATSDCPHFQFFRPMARYHLPFATFLETMLRALSSSFITQYFSASDPSLGTYDINHLTLAYDNVQIVNSNMSDRIRHLGPGDADVNAIIILDAFAILLSFQISTDFLDLRRIFQPHRYF